MSLYLVGHPSSDQREQVLEQTGIILSVQVRQGALLSDGSVWVLNTNTRTQSTYSQILRQWHVERCGIRPHQLSDQRNSEDRAALPPQLQCMERILPDARTYAHIYFTRRWYFYTLVQNILSSPADIFGVVFYVVRKISNLIFGDALQPINNQLQTTSNTKTTIRNKWFTCV